MDSLCAWAWRSVNFLPTSGEIFSEMSGYLWVPLLLSSAYSDTVFPFCLALPSPLLHFLISFNHYDGFERLAATALQPIAYVSQKEGGVGGLVAAVGRRVQATGVLGHHEALVKGRIRSTMGQNAATFWPWHSGFLTPDLTGVPAQGYLDRYSVLPSPR